MLEIWNYMNQKFIKCTEWLINLFNDKPVKEDDDYKDRSG